MRVFWVLVLVVMTWAPSVASACSVCFAGREDENRLAFLLTTGFMTALPIALLGGIVYWLRRRFLALEREHETRLAEPTS